MKTGQTAALPAGGRRAREMSSLGPAELRQTKLAKAWRGYDPEEVDKLLERAAAGFEQVCRERSEARERATRLEDELAERQERERLLMDALVAAERAADQIKADAKQEANRLVTEAHRAVDETRASAERELAELTDEVRRLATLRSELRASYRIILHAALERSEHSLPDTGALASDDGLRDLLLKHAELLPRGRPGETNGS